MTAERRGRRLLLLAALLAALAGGGIWAFRNLGRWLVAPDGLQHARAIVVLSGRVPFRAMEAAEIYREGWAPEVWLFHDESDAADQACARLGIHHVADHEYDQLILERLGVPRDAIRILEPPTTNTVSEARRIAAELRRLDGDRAILVTSAVHTRRAKVIWHLAVGDNPQAILRGAASEPWDADHWWRATQDVEAVVHELLGLINTYLGFIASPRAR